MSTECPTCGRDDFESERAVKIHQTQSHQMDNHPNSHYDWSKEQLRHLYQEKGLSGAKIAERFGCGERTVYDALEKYSIERRSLREAKRKDLPDGKIARLYLEEKMTTVELANKYDVDNTTIRRHLHWEGVELRPTAGENHGMWNGGWKDYCGPNWEEQRQKRLEIDEWQCVICGMSDEQHKKEFDMGLTVHHITPRAKYRDENGELDHERANRIENLVTLCQNHHQEWEGIPVFPKRQP